MATITWGTVGDPFTGRVSLSDGRIIGAGAAENVALDWVAYSPTGNTVGYWPANEGAGTVISDQVGSEHLNSGVGWAGSANAFIGADALQLGGALSEAYSSADGMAVDLSQPFTVGCWYYLPSAPTSDFRQIFDVSWTTSPYNYFYVASFTSRRIGIRFYTPATGWRLSSLPASLSYDGWYHIACVSDGTTLRLYVNGTYVISLSGPATWTSGNRLYVRGNVAGERRDDIFLTQEALYSANFSPTRYPSSGSVACTETLDSAITVSQIDIVASAIGASYGSVAGVDLYTSGGWVEVGGPYTSSPISITGLSTMVPSGTSVLRLRLAPKDNTLKSETVVVDTAVVTYVALPPSDELLASAGTRGENYLPSAGTRGEAYLDSGGHRGENYIPSDGGRG